MMLQVPPPGCFSTRHITQWVPYPAQKMASSAHTMQPFRCWGGPLVLQRVVAQVLRLVGRSLSQPSLPVLLTGRGGD